MSDRPRRGPYPEPLDLDEIASPVHTHRQPRVPWIITWSSIALLVVAVGLLTVYVVRFNDYVAGRGHTRDAENARLRDEIRQGMCDLLDQLPASAVLDGPRHKYGCGPGIPVSQLPPAVRQHWAPPTAAAPTRPAQSPAAAAAAPTVAAAPPTSPLSGATASRTVVPEQPTGPRPPGVPAPTQLPTDPLVCGLVPRLCSPLS